MYPFKKVRLSPGKMMKWSKFAFDALVLSASSLLFSCSSPYLMPNPLSACLSSPGPISGLSAPPSFGCEVLARLP